MEALALTHMLELQKQGMHMRGWDELTLCQIDADWNDCEYEKLENKNWALTSR